MEEKPNYYAIIPAEVRYDNRLRANEKLIYGEITALTYKTGECWASNNYFAKLYETTPQAISRWILNLKKYGYINIDYLYNGKEVDKRVIKVSTYIDRYQQMVEGGINICLGGYQQKVEENNTSINITSINNKKENKKEKYGTYGRVRLTKNEYLKLANEFGEDFIKQQIELLDEYIESNNNKNKYTNFNLVLRKSIRENWFKKNKKKGNSFLDTIKEIYDEQRNNN